MGARLSRTAVENVAVADWTSTSKTQVSVTRRRRTPHRPLVCALLNSWCSWLTAQSQHGEPTAYYRRDSSLACCPRRSRPSLRRAACSPRKSLANTTQQVRFNEVSPILTLLTIFSYCCVCALRCAATFPVFFEDITKKIIVKKKL